MVSKMCGITARFSTRLESVEEMVRTASKLSHRGDGEGLGVFVPGKVPRTYKTLASFNDLETGTIQTTEEFRLKMFEKDSNNKYTKKAKSARAAYSRYVKDLEQFTPTLSKNAKNIVVHNRMPSGVNSINIESTHPLKLNKIRVVHNGSLYDTGVFARYMETMHSRVIEPAIDTNVLLHVFDELMGGEVDWDALTKENWADVYDKFTKIFKGFGVAMFMMGDRTVIFKDSARALYIFFDVTADDRTVQFMSEPLLDKDTYTEAAYIEKGWAIMNTRNVTFVQHDWKVTRMTEKLATFNALAGHTDYFAKECDCCKSDKYGTALMPHTNRTIYCADCYARNQKMYYANSYEVKFDPAAEDGGDERITPSQIKFLKTCRDKYTNLESIKKFVDGHKPKTKLKSVLSGKALTIDIEALDKIMDGTWNSYSGY